MTTYSEKKKLKAVEAYETGTGVVAKVAMARS